MMERGVADESNRDASDSAVSLTLCYWPSNIEPRVVPFVLSSAALSNFHSLYFYFFVGFRCRQ